jgi:hypothetical protein
VKPCVGKRAFGDVIVVIVVRRDGGAVHGEGKEKEEKGKGSSEGGEHRAGWEGAHKGSMTGKGSPL